MKSPFLLLVLSLFTVASTASASWLKDLGVYRYGYDHEDVEQVQISSRVLKLGKKVIPREEAEAKVEEMLAKLNAPDSRDLRACAFEAKSLVERVKSLYPDLLTEFKYKFVGKLPSGRRFGKTFSEMYKCTGLLKTNFMETSLSKLRYTFELLDGVNGSSRHLRKICANAPDHLMEKYSNVLDVKIDVRSSGIPYHPYDVCEIEVLIAK